MSRPSGSGEGLRRPWWQTGVIYQVYPRSFADADGDGVGDLAGIIGRLDYLEGLGVDALWLSPIFPSPMADFGYDVSDYVGVHPLFGTLADFDRLVEDAHARRLKVILDLVPNHTSDEHPWFVESRSSRDNPRRDWYLWADPGPGGGPPNDWQSHFGGSAWEWDEPTGQYYLHLFHRKQPDLNWRNPDVRAAMYDVMRFWFDRGVDGFRIDVLWLLIKDEDLSDDSSPATGEVTSAVDNPGFEDRPEVHEIARQMRAVADEYHERVLIGEIYLPVDRLVRYYGPDQSGIHLPFNFTLVTLPRWDTETVRAAIARYEAALPSGAWPNWVLGNHDVPRIATRVGPERSRLAQMLLLTLRGTPTCYYGDELGMEDVPIPPDRVVDPQARAGRSRDPSRTPMPWEAGPGAGFTEPGVEPWLPLGPDHPSVAALETEPRSHLALFRRLVGLRRRLEALVLGSYRSLPTGDHVLAYLRGGRVLVALNFSGSPQRVDCSEAGGGGTVACSTLLDREGSVDPGRLDLRPYEGVVIAL